MEASGLVVVHKVVAAVDTVGAVGDIVVVAAAGVFAATDPLGCAAPLRC